MTPSGPVDIEVLGKGPGTRGHWPSLLRIRQRIKPGNVVEWTMPKPVPGIRNVRLLVRNMADSWVILHDIEIWRAR